MAKKIVKPSPGLRGSGIMEKIIGAPAMKKKGGKSGKKGC